MFVDSIIELDTTVIAFRGSFESVSLQVLLGPVVVPTDVAVTEVISSLSANRYGRGNVDVMLVDSIIELDTTVIAFGGSFESVSLQVLLGSVVVPTDVAVTEVISSLSANRYGRGNVDVMLVDSIIELDTTVVTGGEG